MNGLWAFGGTFAALVSLMVACSTSGSGAASTSSAPSARSPQGANPSDLGTAGTVPVPDAGAPPNDAQSQPLADALTKARADAGIRSISAIAWRDGKIVAQAATGIADIRTNAAAKPDTIYMIASCSKPVIGLALAILMQEQTVDLDADINQWLNWPNPPRNPAFPAVPVTLRQLVTHRSSLVADDDSEYATYARPDPDPNMEPYLTKLLADPAIWEDFAPGKQEEYSNVGTALAAFVIEKIAKVPFSQYCRERIFAPLGLSDTGWFFSDFNAEQVGRMARPHDESGDGLEHFGFDNWPSGQIRTTTGDLAKLWMAVQSRKPPFSEKMLADFETVTFFIQRAGELFDHGGSEYGVGAYFIYDHKGNGYAFLTNHEIAETASDALDQVLAGILRGFSGIKE